MFGSGVKKGERRSYRGALDAHLTDIRRYEMLTESGEFRLASASRSGEERARNQLVQANLRLVVKIARTFRNSTCELSDLVAEGNVGLVEAANRFDPSRRVRFAAYAAYWIRKYMLLAIKRYARQTTSPGYPPDPERDLGATGSASRRAGRRKVISFDQFLGDPNNPSRLSAPPLEGAHGAEEIVLEKELASALRDLLPKLPARQRTILAAHFGLDGAPPRTLQQIGQALDLTREGVRQIELRALERVRRVLLKPRA